VRNNIKDYVDDDTLTSHNLPKSTNKNNNQSHQNTQSSQNTQNTQNTQNSHHQSTQNSQKVPTYQKSNEHNYEVSSKKPEKKEFTIHSDTSFAMGKQVQNVQTEKSNLPFSINQGTKYNQQQQNTQQLNQNKQNTSQNTLNTGQNINKNTSQQNTKKIDQSTNQPVVPTEGFSTYPMQHGYPMYPPPMYFYPPQQGQNYDPNTVNPNYPMMPFYYMPQGYGVPTGQTQQEDESTKSKKFGGYSQTHQPQYSQPIQGGQPTEIPNSQVPGQFPQFAPYMYYNNQNPYQMQPNMGQGMNLGNPQQLENQGYNTGNYDIKKNTGNDDQPQNFYNNYSYFKQP